MFFFGKSTQSLVTFAIISKCVSSYGKAIKRKLKFNFQIFHYVKTERIRYDLIKFFLSQFLLQFHWSFDTFAEKLFGHWHPGHSDGFHECRADHWSHWDDFNWSFVHPYHPYSGE